MSALTTCGYSGSQFALVGREFGPGQNATVDVMPTADPRTGEPTSTRAVTADDSGRFSVLLDVPASEGTRPVARAVRVRPNPDGSPGMPLVLAAALVKTVSRGVSIRPQAPTGRVGTIERWTVTGLPEGTPLYAHYRRDRKPAKTVALGEAEDPCGRLRFDLRTVPRGHERSGTWEVWLTSRRAFRAPGQDVYVRRRMRPASSASDARVTLEPVRFRLVPADPRAVAPATTFFAAEATQIGVISMIFGSARGAPVDFFERIGEHLKPLGRAQAPAGEQTILHGAARWSCSRLTRRFVASATLPDGVSIASGANTIHTPSCATRFRISVPRRVKLGAEFGVRVVDRWGNGAVKPTLCVRLPGRRESCRKLAFADAVAIATRRFRATKRGIVRIDLRIRGSHARASVGVGRQGAGAPAAPAVLAAGDSMMVGIDDFLADELGTAAQVTKDARPGTGISKPPADWENIAAAEVKTVRPRTTVILLGATDGFPMRTPAGVTAPCCDEPWVAEYARRVRAMMQTYLQGGRGRVFWLTLPLSRVPSHRQVVVAVNTAIARAGEGVAGVTVVRFDKLFTPNGYTDVFRYRGRNVRIRDVDGLHFNIQGQAIAANVVAQLIRASG